MYLYCLTLGDTYRFNSSSIHPFYSTNHSYFHSFIHFFIHSFIHSFYCLFIHAFIQFFIISFVYPFFHLIVHTFVCSFIHSSIHSLLRVFSLIQTTVHKLILSFNISFIHLFVLPIFYVSQVLFIQQSYSCGVFRSTCYIRHTSSQRAVIVVVLFVLF